MSLSEGISSLSKGNNKKVKQWERLPGTRQQSVAESQPDSSVQAFRAMLRHLRAGSGLEGRPRECQLANTGCSHVGRRVTQYPKIEVHQVLVSDARIKDSTHLPNC